MLHLVSHKINIPPLLDQYGLELILESFLLLTLSVVGPYEGVQEGKKRLIWSWQEAERQREHI